MRLFHTDLTNTESSVHRKAFAATKYPELSWVQHAPSSKKDSSLNIARVQKSRQGIPAHLQRYEPLNYRRSLIGVPLLPSNYEVGRGEPTARLL